MGGDSTLVGIEHGQAGAPALERLTAASRVFRWEPTVGDPDLLDAVEIGVAVRKAMLVQAEIITRHPRLKSRHRCDVVYEMQAVVARSYCIARLVLGTGKDVTTPPELDEDALTTRARAYAFEDVWAALEGEVVAGFQRESREHAQRSLLGRDVGVDQTAASMFTMMIGGVQIALAEEEMLSPSR
ncbi:MAG: hypothetical protein ACRD1G_00230 [Acidimicrobiales bacterium]